MEKIYLNIFSLIISCLITYCLIVPTSHVFGLEDSTAINVSVAPSESSQSAATTEQTSKDNVPDVQTGTKNEPQKVDDSKSEQGSLQQTEQADKASSNTDRTPISKQSDHTAKASSNTDRTLPGRVGTVSVKVVSSNQIDLKWTGIKDSDLDHYNVYIGMKSSFKVSSGVTLPSGISNTNSYSSTGLNPSTTYYYKIAAVDSSGNIGALSSAKSAKTSTVTSTQSDGPTAKTSTVTSIQSDGPTAKTSTVTSIQSDGPPRRISGLSISSVSSTQLNLKWSASRDSDFDHYNIYKSTESSFTVTLGNPAGTSTTNSYSSTGLNPSTTYYYKVAAVDKAGHIGLASSAKSGKTKPGQSSGGSDITPPAQVTGLTVSTVSTTQLKLDWNQVKASDFYRYNIYRSTSGFSVTPGVTQPTVTSIANSYSDTGLDPSTTYYYRVAAVDNDGNIGQVSSQVSKTTATPVDTPPPPPPPDTIAPGPVTGLSVSPVSTSQLDLAWSSNAVSDGVARYNIYQGTSPSFPVTLGSTLPTGTSNINSYSSTGLNPSTTYYYKVAAVDSAGNIGPLSPEQSSTTSTPPPPPDTIAPGPVTGLSVSPVSTSQLNLAWSSNAVSDGVEHYNIYRGTSPSFPVTLGSTTPAGTSKTNSYSSTGLNPSTTYYYKVAAVDSAGNIGPLSPEQSSTTSTPPPPPDTIAPGPVTGLSVSPVSTSQLNLAWSSNAVSDGVEHYNIYRGTSPSFPVTLGSTTPAGTSKTNSYSSTGLNPSTTYYYKVAAVDSAGNIGSVSSEKSGTTNPPADITKPSVTITSPINNASLAPGNILVQGIASDNPGGTGILDVQVRTDNEPWVITTPKSAGDWSTWSIQVQLTTIGQHFIQARATDNANNMIWYDTFVNITQQSDTIAPGPVTGLSVSPVSTSQLNLAWSSNAVSDGVEHYNIYRGTSPSFPVTLGFTTPAGTSKTNSYSSTGLNPSTTYYYKVAAVDSAGNIGPLSSENSAATSTPPSTSTYDDFDSGTYTLKDGDTSPNGKWVDQYNGYGSAGVKSGTDGNMFFMYPQTSTAAPGVWETHASLVLSTQKFSDFEMDVDARTNKQLRQNSQPNTWETAWIMFRYADAFHHYYFVLKTNGFELGKKDTSCNCEEQVYLKTETSTKVKIGSWQHINIKMVGKHITVTVDGSKLIEMDDPDYNSNQMSSGAMGLYSEDADVNFDNVKIAKLS